MIDSKLQKELDKINNRLKKIEDVLFESEKPPKLTKKQYEGLSGGIRFLLDNNFFNEPKNLIAVTNELKQEAYHYSKESVSTCLIRDFTKRKKILTRIKEGSKWNYVIRK